MSCPAALCEEVQHLAVPVVRAERPAVVEHDRLGVARPPVLVVDLRAVNRGDRAHGRSFRSKCSCVEWAETVTAQEAVTSLKRHKRYLLPPKSSFCGGPAVRPPDTSTRTRAMPATRPHGGRRTGSGGARCGKLG